mgnify:FL=1|jgi:hypothetical protein
MIDTTAPCTCCADIWVYLDEHINPLNLAFNIEHSDDIDTLHAELTALYADDGGFPVTIDQLDRYIRNVYDLFD